jgi:intracellular multiplication protein IcmB
MRCIVDPEFTDSSWRPVLPGDKIPIRDLRDTLGELSGLQWPPLSNQILPRDAENIDLKTCRIGDRLYATIFVELFPQEIKPFLHLFNRVLSMRLPWRISYWVESGGMETLKMKSAIATILSFASSQNRLLNQAKDALQYTEINTDDAVVRLKVSLSTWAPVGEERLLRTRASELARAVEGWGSCEVSEMCGDAFAGVVSSMLGVSAHNVSPASVAPLSDVIYMLPFTRPSSPWKDGAVLLRSPDGKVWPYQPGSAQQTTWIDLFYARPGSGKSVLSNTINLGLCLAPGIKQLPHIAIIDIGPSSSGLISLLHEALPAEQRHQVAYYRLRMLPEYSINPFDTQLGARNPTPQERAFLVNFLTLLATPLGAEKPYDGISDMSGLIVDEIYKQFSDSGNPRIYSPGVESLVDGILEEIGFVRDEHTTWWEVTDALFFAGFIHEAMLAQRYAMPLLADVGSICRSQAIEDLYGKVVAPTGEPLTQTFGRMISGAVREYPILSRATQFDLGDARVVSLDLDEVAKSGGDAADRQTAVMYMLARYVLARHYYLTKENIKDMPEQYQNHHHDRIVAISQDPKRLVYDEFHRTAKSRAIRDQVITDMREGRKWNVQIALISQSLDDFDSVMVEFATSIFIMDAGPAQAIKKSAEIFGLSETAQTALRTRVHGPRAGGATFLAQFATKYGMNTQLLTSTIGPIELWAFSTTAEDAAIRNRLYQHLGAGEARRVLANIFPDGSAKQVVEKRLTVLKETLGFIEEESTLGVIDQMVKDILTEYSQNPNFKHLP